MKSLAYIQIYQLSNDYMTYLVALILLTCKICNFFFHTLMSDGSKFISASKDPIKN